MDATQLELQATHEMRSQLDQLLDDARMYKSGPDYLALLEFVSRMPTFAPFNAMLLNVQRPGLTYAATPKHWWEKFGRYPKEGARPLLVMHPFGPVAIVFDIQDTEGKPVPESAWAFTAQGKIEAREIESLMNSAAALNVMTTLVDAGDGSAGSIRVTEQSTNKKPGQYRMHVNRNHPPPVQFGTFIHEMAHLCLGHLGPDRKQQIPDRRGVCSVQRELEAESVSYLVSKRRGIKPNSLPYLSQFFRDDAPAKRPDSYEVMRVTGRLERLFNPFSGGGPKKREDKPIPWREDQGAFDFEQTM
jgi:hypothetical protein